MQNDFNRLLKEAMELPSDVTSFRVNWATVECIIDTDRGSLICFPHKTFFLSFEQREMILKKIEVPHAQ